MKKKHISFFWILGTTIIVATTAIMLFVLPAQDRKLSSAKGLLANLEYELDIRHWNYQLFLEHQTKERLSQNERLLQKLLGDDDQAEEVISRMKDLREKSIAKLYLSFTNKVPTKEDKRIWHNMTMDQLIEEGEKLEGDCNINDLYIRMNNQRSRIAELESRKSLSLTWTGIAQVMGLLLISISQFYKDHVIIPKECSSK